jgi:hypothetical protein
MWAESRERAIVEVSAKASALARRGYTDEAEHFRFVARLLTVRAMHEKSKAAALRAADPAHTASLAHTLV